jgi:hypothetical protein
MAPATIGFLGGEGGHAGIINAGRQAKKRPATCVAGPGEAWREAFF